MNDSYSPFVIFVLGTTPRSMGGTPQRGGGGGTTPGRASVRDKLSINPEESLMEEYESGYGAKQQQARIITLITIMFSSLGDQTCTACLVPWLDLSCMYALPYNSVRIFPCTCNHDASFHLLRPRCLLYTTGFSDFLKWFFSHWSNHRETTKIEII